MNKTLKGILLGIFLGLIGLALGMASCETKEEKTQIRDGWLLGVVIQVIIGIIIMVYVNNLPMYSF